MCKCEAEFIKFLLCCAIKTLSTCEKLEIRNKDMAAFKIAIDENKFTDLLNEDLWPVNIIIRPYRNFQKRASLNIKTV